MLLLDQHGDQYHSLITISGFRKKKLLQQKKQRKKKQQSTRIRMQVKLNWQTKANQIYLCVINIRTSITIVLLYSTTLLQTAQHPAL